MSEFCHVGYGELLNILGFSVFVRSVCCSACAYGYMVSEYRTRPEWFEDALDKIRY